MTRIVKHGAAAKVDPSFLQSLQYIAELIQQALPPEKSFALFVIHHDHEHAPDLEDHEVSLISEHTPTEVAALLARWLEERSK